MLQIPVVVHGTFIKAWPSIKKNGLSRMNRQHIHFAPGSLGTKVTSGMRANCTVFIYVDAVKAINGI